MDNGTEKNLTEQYIESQERKARKNKITGIIIFCLIILGIGFYAGYKAYSNWEQEKNAYKHQVLSANYFLLDDFNNIFLGQTANIALKMLFNEEFERDFQKGRLAESIQNINNLERVTAERKFRVNQHELRTFLRQSSYNILDLIDEKELSSEHKAHIAAIYNTYMALQDLYSEMLTEYWQLPHDEKTAAYEKLFYEGAFIYNYVNRAYRIIDGVPATVQTSKSIEREQQRLAYSQEQQEKLRNTISKNEAKEYAEDMYKVLFGKAAALKEKGVSSMDYNVETGTGSGSKDDKGQYITGVYFVAADFKEEEQYIKVDLTERGISYSNRMHTPKEKLKDMEIDTIADDIIKQFGTTALKKIHASRREDVIHYTFRIEDETYSDRTQHITFQFYKDGVIRHLSVGNAHLFYGTYEKHSPSITIEEAMQSIDEEFREDITASMLVYDSRLYYRFTVNKYDNMFYLAVNADTGEYMFVMRKY